jgi:hypothetical protein
MTVAENTNPINSSTANGVTSVFPYEFQVLDIEDITVAVDGVVQTSGFTVTGVGGVGGTVVFTTAPANGALVVLYLDPVLERETDYQQFGDWLAPDVNRDFDRLWLALQGANKRIDAAVHVDLSDVADGLVTKLPAPIGGSAIAWAADGKSLVNIILQTGTTLASLVASTGSTLIGFIASVAGSSVRSVQGKLRDIFAATDRGAVADKTTDNTANILATAIAASAAGVNSIFIPFGTKYNRRALLADATFPVDVVLVDWSGINDDTSTGQTAKRYGIYSRDSAANDTKLGVGSAHHPTFALNNYRSGGTASAAAGKGSILFEYGEHEKGPTDKRGGRTGGMIQASVNDYYANHTTYMIRSLAPGVAILGSYEPWTTGETISGAGVYRWNNEAHYVSAAGSYPANCGATAPVHTTGTVSDGAVSWTFVDYVDRSIIHFTDDGRIMVGSGDFSETLSVKVSSYDASGTFVSNFRATGISKSVNLKGTPTNGSGTEVVQPFVKWDTVNGMSVVKSDGSSALIGLTDAAGLIIATQAATGFTNTSGSGSQDLSGKYVIYMNPSSPFSLTAITNLADWALITMFFGTNAVTIVHSSTLRLTGSVNFVSTLGSSITLRKIPGSISDAVWEESRSIK